MKGIPESVSNAFQIDPRNSANGPFSHLHHNTMQRLLETISCNCEVSASTSLTSMIAFVVMQMRNIELSVKSVFKIYSNLSGDVNKYLSGRSGLA